MDVAGMYRWRSFLSPANNLSFTPVRDTIPSPPRPGVQLGPGEGRIRTQNAMLTMYDSKGSLGNTVRDSRCLSPERIANIHTRYKHRKRGVMEEFILLCNA